jgi:hypothetical protein
LSWHPSIWERPIRSDVRVDELNRPDAESSVVTEGRRA